MDAQLQKEWQSLHRRILSGEKLTTSEQRDYDAGCQELDAEESLDGDLMRLRELRSSIVNAEAEQQLLREREAELDARIMELERRLDQRTRQLLGVTN